MERIDIAGISLETGDRRHRAAAAVPARRRLCRAEPAVSRPAGGALPGDRAAPSRVRPYAAPGLVPHRARHRLSLSRPARPPRPRRTRCWSARRSAAGSRSKWRCGPQSRLGRLVLIDSLGVKFGGREERDIADIYALPADEVLRRTLCRPGADRPRLRQARRPEPLAIARDREATSLYGWRPYMHDPALRALAAPDTRPALVLWGEKDGIVAPSYGSARRRAAERALRTIAACRALPADRAARRGRRRDRTLRRSK